MKKMILLALAMIGTTSAFADQEYQMKNITGYWDHRGMVIGNRIPGGDAFMLVSPEGSDSVILDMLSVQESEIVKNMRPFGVAEYDADLDAVVVRYQYVEAKSRYVFSTQFVTKKCMATFRVSPTDQERMFQEDTCFGRTFWFRTAKRRIEMK